MYSREEAKAVGVQCMLCLPLVHSRSAGGKVSKEGEHTCR